MSRNGCLTGRGQDAHPDYSTRNQGQAPATAWLQEEATVKRKMSTNWFDRRGLIALAAAGALVASSLGTAFAATPTAQQDQGFFGTITAKTSNSFTIQTNNGQAETLDVGGNSQIYTAGHAALTLSDLQVGSRVAVLAEGSGSSWTALRVMPIEAQPQWQHKVITVVSVSGNTVTGQDENGNQVTVQLNHQANANLEGQVVTFVGKSNASGQFESSADVTINNLIARLQAHVKQLKAQAQTSTSAQAKSKINAQLDLTTGALKADIQHHLDVLTQVSARVPVQARASIQNALKAASNDYAKALVDIGESQAEAQAQVNQRTATGVITSVDASSSQITLRTHSGDSLTLNVDATSSINVLTWGWSTSSEAMASSSASGAAAGNVGMGQWTANAGTLADLDYNDVVVRYNAATLTATQIQARTDVEAQGTVQSVDPAAGTVTLQLPNGSTLTLKSSGTSTVRIGGQNANLSDLKVGEQVAVHYNAHTQAAVGVQPTGLAVIHGTITSVDSANGAITVKGDNGKTQTVKVTGNTVIRLRGLLFGLVGLNPDTEATIHYNSHTDVATQIEGAGQSANQVGSNSQASAETTAVGTLSSDVAANGELDISLASGATLKVKATSTTEVDINGQGAAATDLKSGDQVRVRYDVNTMTALQVQARSMTVAKASSTISGTVKSVDLVNGTLDVVTDSGESMTIAVSSNTQIAVHGMTVGLAAIASGAHVQIALAPSTQTNTNAASVIKVTSAGSTTAGGSTTASGGNEATGTSSSSTTSASGSVSGSGSGSAHGNESGNSSGSGASGSGSISGTSTLSASGSSTLKLK